MNEIARIQEFIERDYKKGIAEADERDQVHRQWLADTVEQNTKSLLHQTCAQP